MLKVPVDGLLTGQRSSIEIPHELRRQEGQIVHFTKNQKICRSAEKNGFNLNGIASGGVPNRKNS